MTISSQIGNAKDSHAKSSPRFGEGFERLRPTVGGYEKRTEPTAAIFFIVTFALMFTYTGRALITPWVSRPQGDYKRSDQDRRVPHPLAFSPINDECGCPILSPPLRKGGTYELSRLVPHPPLSTRNESGCPIPSTALRAGSFAAFAKGWEERSSNARPRAFLFPPFCCAKGWGTQICGRVKETLTPSHVSSVTDSVHTIF